MYEYQNKKDSRKLPAGSTHCTPPENSPELALATAFLLCVCVCVCVCARERESVCFVCVLFVFVFYCYFVCVLSCVLALRRNIQDAYCSTSEATTYTSNHIYVNVLFPLFPMQLFLVGVLQVFCLCDTTRHAKCIMQHIGALCVCSMLCTLFF